MVFLLRPGPLGCLQFLRGSALLRPFALFCARFQTCSCPRLRSFALFCTHLSVSAANCILNDCVWELESKRRKPEPKTCFLRFLSCFSPSVWIPKRRQFTGKMGNFTPTLSAPTSSKLPYEFPELKLSEQFRYRPKGVLPQRCSAHF